jgi:hypothetical protein
MKYLAVIFFVIIACSVNAQIRVEKFDLTIQTALPDTLQKVYEEFLNTEVDKISIVRLKKKYDSVAYNQFLKTKKFYQNRKKWKKNHSYEESIIIEGEEYEWKHFDSIVFEFGYDGIESEFIQSEVLLDSTEMRITLNELFNGTENELMIMCYNPRHAIIFYNSVGEVSGIYEICFECSKVKVGIVGTLMFNKSLPRIKELFEKYGMETAG